MYTVHERLGNVGWEQDSVAKKDEAKNPNLPSAPEGASTKPTCVCVCLCLRVYRTSPAETVCASFSPASQTSMCSRASYLASRRSTVSLTLVSLSSRQLPPLARTPLRDPASHPPAPTPTPARPLGAPYKYRKGNGWRASSISSIVDAAPSGSRKPAGPKSPSTGPICEPSIRNLLQDQAHQTTETEDCKGRLGTRPEIPPRTVEMAPTMAFPPESSKCLCFAKLCDGGQNRRRKFQSAVSQHPEATHQST
ncbi:hypothetical protein ZHAS_00005129 [Anopheles sinensis]|uniref:Uncharacterized protein n=1 Tax=Anopheles sinensis TaxID=74873 RepID=A0A084VJ15_ANOSI|nr:hypothetical protein ZHAS_00005129 [Anopheles sinensis]